MEYLCDVLLFGEMGEIGPQVHRLLSLHGIKAILVPFPQNLFNDEPGYRRALCKAILEYRPRFTVPIGHPLAMSRFKALCDSGVPLRAIVNSRSICPEYEEAVVQTCFMVENEAKIRLLDSKVELCRLALSLGLPVPRVYNRLEDIDWTHQIVFKRDISFGGHGVHLPKTPEALNNLIAHQSPGEPYLIQDFIEGEDYSLDIVRSNYGFYFGGYKCVKPKGNGPAVERIVLSEGNALLERMLQCALPVLEQVGYCGVCGFDFRVTSAGDVFLLEANPRFTGGVAAQAASGFNTPLFLARFYFSSAAKASA